ncbi:hypothetical protein MRX96_028134 [Rhipicephalus microplus]
MERKRASANEENGPPKCNGTLEKREEARLSLEKLHFVSPTAEGAHSEAESTSFFTSDEASSSSGNGKSLGALASASSLRVELRRFFFSDASTGRRGRERGRMREIPRVAKERRDTAA